MCANNVTNVLFPIGTIPTPMWDMIIGNFELVQRSSNMSAPSTAAAFPVSVTNHKGNGHVEISRSNSI
eukprot:scaffold314807_cov43-Attheya_sp.AAC.1